MRAPALILGLLFASPALYAAEPPVVGITDPHLQTVAYDPDQVVTLRGRMGYQMMIEFDAAERIENVAIGDALLWQVTPNKRANKLFLKPLDRRATTNMTVVTDRRRYTFALNVAPDSASASATPWVVRFQYRELVILKVGSQDDLPPPPVFNQDYAMAGARGLWPVRVYDDGRSTYFEWTAQAALPAIFAAATDGEETLVNHAIKGNVVVVQQTADRFILRSGKAKAIVGRSGAAHGKGGKAR